MYFLGAKPLSNSPSPPCGYVDLASIFLVATAAPFTYALSERACVLKDEHQVSRRENEVVRIRPPSPLHLLSRCLTLVQENARLF